MTRIHGARGRQGPPRRPRPLLVGLSSAVLLAVLLAWMRYDPVEGGDVSWCPQPSTLLAAGDIDPVTGEQGAACTVVNTEATSVAFAATVRNAGFLPVVVREARMRGEIQGVLRVEGVRMAARNGAEVASSRELVTFAPFRLRPGDQRLVEVHGTLPACEEVSRARVATLPAIPVRISVFGLPHDSSAGLVPPVQLIAEPC